MDVDLGMDLERTIQEGRTELREGLYRNLLCLGEEDGHPIFTFTAAGQPGAQALNPPGPRYLSVIARGLRETFGLSEGGIVEYLQGRPGIEGFLPPELLERIVREAGSLYPDSFS